MSFEPRGFCASLSQKLNTCVRTIRKYFLLFEKLINVVHEHAPRAKLCFNTNPGDTAEAVRRWV